MAIPMNHKQKLLATIAISFSFFVAELTVGFYTHSLALIADAFHYLCDLIGFVVALVAVMKSEDQKPPPRGLTFGWARATLLGSFFNGVFILSLGTSILVQAIERFVHVTSIDRPKLILIVGCIGLALNLLVLSFLHEHDHGDGHGHGHGHGHNHRVEILQEEDAATRTSDGTAAEAEARPTPASDHHHEHKHVTVIPSRLSKDLGMVGVVKHVIGDAASNVGVIISALIIWKAHGEARYYADPVIGVLISLVVLWTGWPLTRNSGRILLQIAPKGINPDDVKCDIEKTFGVDSVHELHIWQLDERRSVASMHVFVDSREIKDFEERAKIVRECLHAYGIHSVTLQPELKQAQRSSVSPGSDLDAVNQMRPVNGANCQTSCGDRCGDLRCCH